MIDPLPRLGGSVLQPAPAAAVVRSPQRDSPQLLLPATLTPLAGRTVRQPTLLPPAAAPVRSQGGPCPVAHLLAVAISCPSHAAITAHAKGPPLGASSTRHTVLGGGNSAATARLGLRLRKGRPRKPMATPFAPIRPPKHTAVARSGPWDQGGPFPPSWYELSKPRGHHTAHQGASPPPGRLASRHGTGNRPPSLAQAGTRRIYVRARVHKDLCLPRARRWQHSTLRAQRAGGGTLARKPAPKAARFRLASVRAAGLAGTAPEAGPAGRASPGRARNLAQPQSRPYSLAAVVL